MRTARPPRALCRTTVLGTRAASTRAKPRLQPRSRAFASIADGRAPVHAHFMTFGDAADPPHMIAAFMPSLTDNIQKPDLQRLYAYLSRRRRGRQFPARRGIDPFDFRY